jgi:Tfp pilus assembly PilM family ATPase/Tfp pilus assembly protein PilN
VARKGIASIGVDFGARELRAVEVSPDGRTIKQFSSVLMPSVGVDKGVPSDPNTLAELFRELLRELKSDSKLAIFGLPAQAVTTRVLDIPQVPDNELRVILEGEVQHYGIIRGFGGMFDYARIEKPTGKDSEPQALVMACEAVQLNAIRDAAERARVGKGAIEPAMLGLIRLAASQMKSAEPALLVAVQGDIAEMAVTVDHKTRLYRRLELSLDTADDRFIRAMGAEPEETVPAFLRAEAGSGVGNQLVIELKRTLDYVSREFDSSGPIKQLVLAVSNSKEAPLAQLLAENLEMEVTLAKAPLPDDDGFQYAAAYGLAMGSSPLSTGTGVPLFDLSPYDPVEEENQKQQRYLATSLVSSIFVVLASVAAALIFGRQAMGLEHEISDRKAELAEIERVALPEAMRRQAKLEAYRMLIAYGVPVPQVVDSLTQVLDDKTGLSSIEIKGNSLAVSGESASEASMIQTLEQIRTKPGFRSAFIESFDQNADEVPKVVKFKLTAQLGTGAAPK